MSDIVDLEAGAIDGLLPMHVLLDEAGTVVRAGPGFVRLAGERRIVGRPVLECFNITRPSGIDDPARLMEMVGQGLHLRLREGRAVQLRGILVPRPGGHGALLNLSLALSELSDLGGAGLTNTDFSPTDMTVDMLYLIEAKSAAMAESRRLIDRLQGAKSVAEEQAFTDTLTGLRNRRALDHRLGRLIAEGLPFALCHADLDFFKDVNDTLGHAAGDQVLQSVARALIEATRGSDTVARVGGDEFVVLFHGLVDPETLDRIACRIIEGIERPVVFQGTPCHISASLGTAISTDYAIPAADRIMKDADTALYASKEAGRAQHTIFRPAPVPQEPAGAVLALEQGRAEPAEGWSVIAPDAEPVASHGPRGRAAR